MRPKQFPSLWYNQRKPCLYLGPTLALSPNGPKQVSTRPTSPRSSIGCIPTDFQAYGTFDAKRATILRRRQHYLQTDRNEISHDPHHLGVPSGATKMISEPLVCSAPTAHLSCVKISTISKRTETSFHLSLVTQENHRCVKNDVYACGMFGANHAPILHRH